MITETEIDERLRRLRGKVPNFLIDDLKDRLMKKRDILTPEQVDRIVDKVLRTYAGQIEKLSRLDSRVDEIGRYLEEIRNHLMNLSQTAQANPSMLEEAQYQPMGGTQAVDFGEIMGAGNSGGFSEGSLGSESPVAEEAQSPEPPSQNQAEVVPMEKEFELTRGFEIPPELKDVLVSPPRTKARLEHIPNDMVSTMMALKWLGFLIDRVGMQNLEEVLEFYYQIGWISEDVLNTLLRYAEGIRPHHREPDWRPDEKLTIQDHLVSLLFIERLRGVRITREVLDAIEREMRVIGRVLEDVYGV
ncbi:FlaD/FlaE family flagellar protein [Thermococcus thioreducens]|uniref:Flagellar protein n=1 Tax=Thermococcus thioreducens TaxID=277988 RepID=A0A0Q2UNM3_9EURY|nr:FlaD/FlaE family flagellar protein [Thermococcus thioreducens]ASJ12812.1 flagellar protein [Thermococcus thioreducens]KQH82280.1 flagellar protein [Thermococcus thioreducens]SEV84866.1 flagellar protein FlaD [Thermococcus thioreducens]